ncbi:hypothetical protein [Coprococcus eutactus]|uniref:hypothetical protein n=2 Tax=Clostridia TaxID=186801 RepID=UPI001D07C506|nr:hypothetical protein [Coprococcus eutactus]MCB6629616.1 hypothetical protein [Coprococcus eutactus]MCG4790784.1 hypothetical protein [Coprococcus eutactus]MCQ5119494.1 hypothetical protein [Coprococcus eutactus]MCQ5133154.1 hypothetical protein [Coprococcus eutactus]MCQ5136303.1 hypothetical protein [Coprococcus eutactus]
MIIKKLQEELDKNEEYKDLLLERKEILRSNGFINKLQPRFEAICERLQEIDNETQKKLWGEVVLKDSEDEDIDFSFRDTSENVFQEALKTYCDNNKSRREYEKRMGMITDEERLRVKEFIEQLEAQRKKQSKYIHEFVKRKEYSIVGKIRRNGFSQRDVDRQWNQIVNMIRKKQISGVVVANMAAISSSVADAYFKVGLVIEAGGIVVTVDEGRLDMHIKKGA